MGLDWRINDGPSDLPDGLITTSVVHHHPFLGRKVDTRLNCLSSLLPSEREETFANRQRLPFAAESSRVVPDQKQMPRRLTRQD